MKYKNVEIESKTTREIVRCSDYSDRWEEIQDVTVFYVGKRKFNDLGDAKSYVDITGGSAKKRVEIISKTKAKKAEIYKKIKALQEEIDIRNSKIEELKDKNDKLYAILRVIE